MSCARETTLVSSRVLSTVERVLVRAGGRVEADDLLVSPDQRDLKARLESLTASRAAIDARLQEAQKTLVRTEELLERDLLSQADADKAVAAEAALLAERQAVNETAKELEAAVSYTEAQIPSGEELWRAIPEEFVQHLGQLNLVWIESPSGPVKRFVRVGRTDGNYLEIIAGLEDGDRLIAKP